MIHRAPGSPRREYIPESYSPLSSVNHNQFTYSSGEEEEGDIEPRAQTPVVPITPHATVPQPPSPRSSNKKLYLGLALLALIVAVVVIPKGSKAPARPLSHTFRANCSELMDLNKKFPNQDKKLFKSLRYGVEATVNHKPPELTVFSLFSTDESLIEKLMASVIEITKECISQPQDPLDLTVDYLSEKMITDYEHELKQRSIMIIRDVGDANPETVAALHSICDTENPLVAESIIFFTLKVPKAPAGKPVDYIFDYLNERWSGLAEHIRAPLITRMLDQTFFLKP